MQQTTDLHSIGHVCVLLSQVPGTIRAASEAIGQQPAMTLDGVPHFSREQIELLRTFFQDKPRAGTSDDPQLRRRRLHK